MKPRNKKSSRRRKSRRSNSNGRLAGFQLLENRRMLATFSVTNTGLSGSGSLPQAIFDSNSAAGADTIDIASGLGTIQMTDQLSVSDSVTIQGNGNTIAGNTDVSRIFGVSSGAAQFNLNDVTLSGGGSSSLNGGAIESVSSITEITITDSVLTGNIGVEGGAIYAMGTVIINNSQIIGNESTRSGGGIELGNRVSNYAGSPSASLTISNSTVSGNTSQFAGGGIYAYGHVTLTDSTVSGNSSIRATGGGIVVTSGDVMLTNSTVSENTSGRDGGGLYTYYSDVTLTDSTINGNTSGFDGGGVFTMNGNLTLSNSTVSENTASESGGGIGLDAFSSTTLTLTDSTVSGNSSGRDGGGIDARGDVTLSDSSVSGNTSEQDGGGISVSVGYLTLTNSTVSSNAIAARGGNSSGGGISASGDVTLANSTVSNNLIIGSGDKFGGGISAFSGNVTLTSSTVSGNSIIGADDVNGGGIFTRSGDVTLTGSTVSENTSTGRFARGGGIYADSGDVMLTNSTVSGNSTTGNSANGGGIYTDGSDVTLTNSTIAGNTTTGRGGGIGYRSSGGALTVLNSIIAGNSDNGTAPDFEEPSTRDVRSSIIGDTTGTTLTAGNNNQLDVDFTTVLETEVVNGIAVPLLADNGGSIATIALLASSPAIDAGDNTLAFDANGNSLLTDQRGDGFERFIDGDDNGTATVDIGAFEVGAAPAFLLGDVNQNGVVNFLDIAPFIGVLSSNGFQDEADIDQDGAVTFLDISHFIDLLSSQGTVEISTPLFAAPLNISLPPSEVVSAPLIAEPSQPSLQTSDGISGQLIAVPASLPLTQSDVAPLQLSAAPLEPSSPSLLAHVDGSQVHSLDDSPNLRNGIPAWNSDSAAIQLSEEKTDSRAQQEKSYDADSQAPSLLGGSQEPAITTSSADLFDTQPELLDELQDFELDEVFNGLLIK